MQVPVEGNELVIRLPLEMPKLSSSGKTMLVATTRGNVTTDAMVDGKNVTIGVNAYISKD